MSIKIKAIIAKQLQYKLITIHHKALDDNGVDKFEVFLIDVIKRKTDTYPKISIPVREKWCNV
jgi:hypothetical protein